MPDDGRLVRAFERAGHELTERMQAVLDDVIATLTAEGPPEPDAGTPSGPAESAVDRSGREPASPAATSVSPPAPALIPEPAPATPPPAQAAPSMPIGGEFVERGHLEAAFDGHSARIALAHNGTVALEFGTPVGDSRFELRPGPFGLPVVVRIDEPAVTHSAEPAPPHSDAPAAEVARPDPPVAENAVTPPDAPAPRMTLDTPEAPLAPEAPVAPEPPAPEPPPAAAVAGGPEVTTGGVGESGARLMEAGPL